jgi:hypothetical protein
VIPPTPGRTIGLPSAEILYGSLNVGLTTSPTTEILTSLFSFVFNILDSVLVDRLRFWMLIKLGSVFCSVCSTGIWQVLNEGFFIFS